MPDPHGLTDKTVFVTGAGSGIGRATAKRLAARDAQVAAVDVAAEDGQATVESIKDDGGAAAFIEADVSRSADVEAAVEQAAERFGRLDAAVNVVGVSGRKWGDGPAHECTEEAWDNLMDVNLKSMYLCSKFVLRNMLGDSGDEEDSGGAIVNVSSVLGLVGGDEDFATHAYAASKGGIISFTRALSTYYAERGIRANVICPGLIATAMSERAQGDAHIQSRLAELQPLTADFGQPGDVAEAACYLVSDRASFVTGTVFPVDGGWTAK